MSEQIDDRQIDIDRKINRYDGWMDGWMDRWMIDR